MSSTPRDRYRFLGRSGRDHQKTPILAEAPGAAIAGTVATMRLYDPIDSYGEFWGVSAKEFAQALDDLSDEVTEIRLHINSPGGEIFEGVAILNLLRNHPARVVTVVDGLAASAASFIAMAGDEVVMARNAEMMIHDAWGVVVGNAADMHGLAEDLDRMSNNMATIYADRAGGTVEQWRAAMAEETWYTDVEAVAAGLADRVIPVDPKEADKAKARFDLSVFAHAGREKSPAPKTPAPPSASGPLNPPPTEGSPAVTFTDDQLSTLRQRLGVDDTADEAAILTALVAALDAEPEAVPAQLPEGVVTIDSTVLEELQVAARAGVAARAQQETEGRERLVASAVQDGRIRPASREAWLNKLAADPDGEAALASLSPGLVPVAAVGYVGSDDAPSDTAEAVRETSAYKNWSR